MHGLTRYCMREFSPIVAHFKSAVVNMPGDHVVARNMHDVGATVHQLSMGRKAVARVSRVWLQCR